MTKKELIAELRQLLDKYDSLKELYLKEKNESNEENSFIFKEQKWLNYIIEATKTGIDVIDEDYNLLFVDLGWQKVYGNPYGRKCYEYFMGQKEPCPNCAIPEALKSKKIIISEEFLKKENRFVEVHTIPFQNEKGEWLVGEFNVDITERKKIENELIGAKDKAEESDRLKTAFLHNLSHEIRTPLNTIVGFSERINTSKISEEKRIIYTDIIIKSSFQLLAIVSDILTMSTIDTNQEIVNNEKVCINSLITELELAFSKQIGSKELKFKSSKFINDKDLIVLTDRGKVTQILSTLLSNAIKFTNSGEIIFGYKLEEQKIEFFVRDTGIGIDSSKQDLIFKRFVQADDTIQVNYGGTGLGLSISKGLVEILGGNIWVDSELGKGSTFYFSIPYIKPITENIIENHSPRKEQLADEIIILIAEDQEPNYLYLQELLSDFDCKTILAKNGAEAVSNCINNNSISIVLMDIKMPIMDGYSAAKKIKEMRPDLPIIAQTAYATEQDLIKYNHIFDDYLTKPYSPDKLAGIINKHLYFK
jgi:signal transduction histidine kinase/CheY-like chemotaxis protein